MADLIRAERDDARRGGKGRRSREKGGALRTVHEALQHQHNELHWRVVVVQHQHFVIGRLLGLGTRARRDTGLDLFEAVAIPGTGGHQQRTHAHHAMKYGELEKCRKSVLAPWR